MIKTPFSSQLLYFGFCGVFLASLLWKSQSYADDLSLSAEQRTRIGERCIEWFLEKGLDPSYEYQCVSQCAVKVDMGTFHCPKYCEDLCKALLPSRGGPISRTLDLCPEEVKLARENLQDAFIVNEQRHKAVELTESVYQTSRADDESDALRHFLWSFLVCRELGANKAQSFMDAHESCAPRNKYTKMDRFNNSLGIETCKRMREDDEVGDEKVLKEGLRLLKEKKLIVEKPRKK